MIVRVSCVGMMCAVMMICAQASLAEDACTGFGPQSPRDITNPDGVNKRRFSPAPPASSLNLCNIHTHTNAEHRGPGFSVLVGHGQEGGYACDGSLDLTASEREEPAEGKARYGNVKPGDTIEVHWVFSSCDITPGAGLGSCFSESCKNPDLRVETQVFLVVNDPKALDFADFTYRGRAAGGLHQPKSLPSGTGVPVTYAGSTTGPAFSQAICSPFQVTWSVRPVCAKVHIGSLHKWVEDGNVFQESHSHGVRELVTSSELLAPLD